MQKDIQTSKGEISQQKYENQPFTDKPSVGETAGHKLKEVGHNVNATLKENVGVGVGNYSSFEDRQRSGLNEQKYEEKKSQMGEKINEQKEEIKKIVVETTEKVKGMTEPIGHKVQEIAHDVNATLKQNLGIGIGNYPSEVDEQISQEHKEKFDEQIQGVKQKVEAKKEEIKANLGEKIDVIKERVHEGTLGLYTHRLEEVAHTINANLKEKIGIGIGDYSSQVDRQKAEEHWEEYMQRVKESTKVEITDSNPIVHKIKEVAHTVNANFKELIGVGVGNYSSEVDRELSELHHQKYLELKQSHNAADSNAQFDTPTLKEEETEPTQKELPKKEAAEEKKY